MMIMMMKCMAVMQLRTEAPYVYRQPIACAEYDFRSAVEARLNVRVDLLMLVTTRPEVDHLYTAASHLHSVVQQNATVE